MLCLRRNTPLNLKYDPSQQASELLCKERYIHIP
jgi:hypothetical protein